MVVDEFDKCQSTFKMVISIHKGILADQVKSKKLFVRPKLFLRFHAGMSDVHCSFLPLVGGQCTFDRRDKTKSTKIVPLLACDKDISGHRSSLVFSDVTNEVDLVLARASIFTRPRNIAEFTICPYHRSKLGVGWYRGSTRCRVPQPIADHPVSKQQPKAERGIGKQISKTILQRTGIFVAVGSGMCRNCRGILSKDEHRYLQSSDGIQETYPMDHTSDGKSEETTLVSQFEGLTLAAEYDRAPQMEKRTSLYVPATISDSSEASSGDGQEQIPSNSLEFLNMFLEEKHIGPITATLTTSWETASKRTKRRHVQKAGDAVTAVLEEIAPNEPSKLWHALKKSKAMKDRFHSEEDADSTTLDTVLLDALSECYENSSHWSTRRQILSVMADKLSLPKLRKWIPGLTEYRYNVAKHHLVLHGRGSVVSTPAKTRMRVPPQKLEHFLSFITSPHLVQDLPFGEKSLTLSSGEVIRVPGIVRSLIPERIVAQYQSVCSESSFEPLSRSTLLRILDVCSASQRSSLQGLDYYSASGAKAFDDLEVVVDKLGDSGMGMSWAVEKKEILKTSKRYLKGDYKVHVCKSSDVPDHCIPYALSDPKECDYQASCDHQHNQTCDRCWSLTNVLREIKEAQQSITECSLDTKDQWAYDISTAKQAIIAWKAHLIRSVNQDEARIQVLDDLDDSSVLLVQDWAMKFLPRKYRESQSDWFGKRGIPWHVTVAIRKGSELEMMTFVHIFPTCPQDSHTVLAIMCDVMQQLKVVMPNLTKVFYRQDNAGCYHSSSTVVGAKEAAEKNQVTLVRMDFSDPQGGKGACDRKAATIKSHVRVHLNSGHDVESAQQLKVAIQSDGGVPGVHVAVYNAPSPRIADAPKWDGISLLNNFSYCKDGIRVWRSYKVGPGKLVAWDRISAPLAEDIPPLVAVSSSSPMVSFTAVKARHGGKPQTEEAAEVVTSDPYPDSSCSDSLFTCPEEGCVMSFFRLTALQHHLDCGKHKRELERETLQDKAMIGYAQRLERGTSKPPEIGLHESGAAMIQPASSETQLEMGWALKSAGVRRTRFSAKQKTYLTKVFEIGELTGRKANASDVARNMRTARELSGNRIFNSDEFLTPQQIAGFFSRVAASKSVQGHQSQEKAAEEERLIQEIRNQVEKEVALNHPLVYDGHNICELAAQEKLVSFSIKMLQDLCHHFEVDISAIRVKRKAPYIDRVVALVKQCTCHAAV